MFLRLTFGFDVPCVVGSVAIPLPSFSGTWVATTRHGIDRVVRRGRITEGSLDSGRLFVRYSHDAGHGQCEAIADAEGLLFEGRWEEAESHWHGTVSMVRTEPPGNMAGQFFGEFEGRGPNGETASGVWILGVEKIDGYE